MARKPGGEAAIKARMAAAPGLSREDGHRLAGLLEAEGHLAVSPNNRNGWRCYCAVALRDDDGQVLKHARDRLGLGHLAAIPARNGSRPQLQWTVESKIECAALVDLLDAHPLRGRKLEQYEIWREAVDLCASRPYRLLPDARLRLGSLATALRKARAYRAPGPHGRQPVMIDRYARHYFAGFFSGEGSFGLGPRDARFQVKLRRDDRPLLQAFRAEFGIGSISDVAVPPPWSPAAVWHVVAARDVLRGIALFEAGGLLGRKRRQFEAWRPGADAVANAKVAREPVDKRVVQSARRNLAFVTAYQPPAAPLRRDRGHADARTAYIDVLRAWAALADGRLSCTGYEAARRLHPHWPKRDTIAFAFGGWYEALRSAGLAERAARRPSAG
jgi:LAGLIDADG DNA endonuclease family protein